MLDAGLPLDLRDAACKFQSGWMNCIATKVAQKILMFFQHHDFNSGAGEEKAEHHPGPPPMTQQRVRIFSIWLLKPIAPPMHGANNAGR